MDTTQFTDVLGTCWVTLKSCGSEFKGTQRESYSSSNINVSKILGDQCYGSVNEL